MSGRRFDITTVIPLETNEDADVRAFDLSVMPNGHIRLEMDVQHENWPGFVLDMAREDAVDLMILLGAALQAGRDLAPPGNPQKA